MDRDVQSNRRSTRRAATLICEEDAPCTSINTEGQFAIRDGAVIHETQSVVVKAKDDHSFAEVGLQCIGIENIPEAEKTRVAWVSL